MMANRNKKLARASARLLDTVLGKPFHVLDDGFIRVVDYMGNDAAILQAARVSYGTGTRKVQSDRALIRYLMRHAHTTPFEMCEIKFHVRVPMDTWRQWIRHRTANVNEYSTRYSLAIDAAQKTAPDKWRLQSTGNRQGSSSLLSRAVGKRLSEVEIRIQREVREAYKARIAEGVAREQARKDLPLSTYTEAYWKIDLHNLFHFLWLRMDSHAQQEIRAYATTIGEKIVARWVPAAWEAFLDFRRDAIQLSRIETVIVQALISNDKSRAIKLAAEYGLLHRDADGKLAPSRERVEIDSKLAMFGLKSPWK